MRLTAASYQLVTVALCLQHLTVIPFTTCESRSNTCAIIPKAGARFKVRGNARWLKIAPLNSCGRASY